jgi:hypothetical protein
MNGAVIGTIVITICNHLAKIRKVHSLESGAHRAAAHGGIKSRSPDAPPAVQFRPSCDTQITASAFVVTNRNK